MANKHVVSFSVIFMILLGSINCEKELNVKITKFEKILEDTNDFSVDIRLGEPDEQGIVKLSGEVKQMVMLDNDWKVKVSIFIHDGDKKIEIPPKGVCDFLSTYYKQFFYEKLKDYANAPDPNTCPLPPENYEVKGYPLDGSEFKKFLKAGKYSANAKLFKDDELKMEYLIEALIE